MSTPASKRLNTEMSFSPETHTVIDKKEWRSILSDLLEEKFETYMSPLQAELAEVKKDIKILKSNHEKTTTSLQQKINNLETENTALKQQIEKVESYQRKNNLRIIKLKESSGENLEVRVTGLFNEFLHSENRFGPRTFKRIHRLGKFKKYSDRMVMVRFAHYKDKITALQAREALKKKYNIILTDDMSQQMDSDNRALYPIFAALRDLKKHDDQAAIQSLKLRGDKLMLNDKSYGVKDIGRLPQPFTLDNLFNVSRNGITGFFRSYSKLSNHFKCTFNVRDVAYTSMEQFLMYEKARVFNDQEKLYEIQKENNPVLIKQRGKEVKNFKQDVWESEIETILITGLTAKFLQNEELLCFLKATGQTLLAEANPHDRLFGVGLSLYDKGLWNQDDWKGKNQLGMALMKVRDMLK